MKKSEQLYSAGDLSKRFGKSHQYWSRLMTTGKIKAYKTASGFITTHAWLTQSGFINKKL